MTQAVPPRREVPVEHTWDAYSIYPSDEAWEAAFRELDAGLEGLSRFRGKLDESPALLADALHTSDTMFNTLYKLYVYASMFHEVDTADQEAAAKDSRVRGLSARVYAALSFLGPELLMISGDTLKQWLHQEPRLAHYGHYFDQLEKRRAHVRSVEVEELLGQVSEPFQTATNAHSVLVDADFTFPSATNSQGEAVPITQGTIFALLTDPDREVRRTAFENYADVFLASKNAIASTLAAGVQQNVFTARARRYPSALDAALSAVHIPTEVFHNLIATFRKNLPTWHRYWEIRRKALGYDRLHVYDCKAPLTQAKPNISYTQAVDWICEGMEPLGDAYVSVMRKGCLEQRWVDIYPNQNKRMGAFSSGSQGTHPFILMSYNDDIYSLSTLAHELGHSMHSYYTWKTQPPVYADYSIFVAEVASNFNQALVREYLLRNNPDPQFQIAVIEEAMSNYHRYFLVMPTLARFELEMHERTERGEALTAESLMELMTELFKECYGEKMAVDEPRVGITWAQFPTHLYSNFYVYQYATGISGAHALAAGVAAGKPGAAENYLNFLKSGGSMYPLDALRMAGVDLSQPEPVDKAFANLADLVERLATLLNVA